MLNYINKTLGLDVQMVSNVNRKNIPLYLKNEYIINIYRIENIDCLFVKPINFNLSNFKKHQNKLIEIFDMNVVLELDIISQYQRKILIDEKISFVVKDYQAYMPFLAIHLTKKFKQINPISKFYPITQLVFLYIFYNKAKLTATELAKILDCSNMSVTRAYKDLVNCNLFTYESKGRNKYIVPNYNGGELLKKAEKYLSNQIERLYYAKDENEIGCILSGTYALSKKTMISSNVKEKSYAMTKKDIESFKNLISKEEYEAKGGIILEKWAYPSFINANDGIIDDISLILSLSEVKDERIMIEIEKLKEKYEW